MQKNFIKYESLGKILNFAIFCILIFSIIFIYSTTSPLSISRYGDSFFFLKKHLVWIFVSYILLFFGYFINLNFLKENSIFFAIFSIFLLSMVFVPKLGVSVGGAKRWINLYIFNLKIQPSEISKIFFIIYIAGFLDRKKAEIKRNIFIFLKSFILPLIGMILIYEEPDFGNVFLLIVTFIVISLVFGIDRKIILGFILSVIIFIIYGVISTPYRIKRVLSFLDPFMYANDGGYQIVQAFLAMGTAGLMGKGIGNSVLKLNYLPEAHTDFILAIIAEELGLLGSVIIILFYVILIFISTKIITHTKDYFQKILGFGIILIISIQAIINIAVVIGFFPTKGITLPFLSFGGSSLCTCMFSIGLMLNIYKNNYI